MDEFLSRLFSSEKQELYTLDLLAYTTVFFAVCTFFTTLFENIPYGRYASSRYGFPVSVKFAWFVQELPAILVPVCLLFWTRCSKASLLPNQILIAMYMCHYVQRSLIYPFLIRGGKPTPCISFILAFVFCTYNGYMQIRYLSHYSEYTASWVTHPCFITGSVLWLAGWLVNVHSDYILRNLRKPGETGYKIPTVSHREWLPPPPRTQSQQQYCRLELAVNLSNNPLQTLKENKVEKSRRVEAVSCVTPNELQGTSGIFSAKNLPFSQGRVAALLLAWPAVK
uniref:3-oxo-5-alpha-steroid 4-dehydrogenase C-terminal domain-containing protein n=1 Tax=Cynoglossus semilaevis TaxID=244447 RepID=A0A3P8VRS6_CYNSE